MKPRILVIDDEEEILSALRRYLEYALEAEVLTACEARSAMSLYREKTPMVILSDIQMPGLSGVEVLKDVKSHYPAIQVLIMTGQSTLDRSLECLEAGAVDYLMKPLDMDILEKLVREALERYERWHSVIKINLHNKRLKNA